MFHPPILPPSVPTPSLSALRELRERDRDTRKKEKEQGTGSSPNLSPPPPPLPLDDQIRAGLARAARRLKNKSRKTDPTLF
jgi:hypothetical protein